MATKLGYGYSFTPIDLLNETFIKTLGQNQSIAQAPWFISMDGVLFL